MALKKGFYPENKRTKETLSLKEAFAEMLETFKLKQKFEEFNIVTRWEEITGKTIASRTSKIYIRDKKLFLEITSAPLKQQLIMSKTKLIDLLNKGHEKPIVTEIRFI